MPYSQLDKTSRAIRLLILSPNLHPADNRIQCRLILTSLNEFPSYDALSYQWGRPDEFGFKIWINGKLILVRQNLYYALLSLRNDVERVLWIDALCINQYDKEERGHQVEMMGDIYRMAHWVLVWLGMPELGMEQDKSDCAFGPPTSNLAFRFLEVASKRASTRFSEDFDYFEWMDDFFHNPELNEHWKELARICSLDYWKRLWIIQEVCLATKLKVIYGATSIDWTCFRVLHSAIGAFSLLRQDGPHLRHPQADYSYRDTVKQSQPWKLVTYMQCQLDPNSGPTFESLLELSMYCECLEKKDKVFGILGMANDVPKGAIAVNYSQSLFQLYTCVMQFQLRRIKRHKADALLVPFSQLLQKTLLGPGCGSGELHLHDMYRRGYDTNLTASLDEDSFRVTGWTTGIVALESCHLKHIIQKLSKTDIKTGNFDRERLCDAWRRRLQEIEKYDSKTFTLLDGTRSKETPGPENQGLGTEITIFVTDDMAVGIGPKGIRPGDRLWKYQGDRFHAIIRGEGDDFKVIGRVVVTNEELRWDADSKQFRFPEPAFYGAKYKIGRGVEAGITVDIPMLQALTCPLHWERLQVLGS